MVAARPDTRFVENPDHLAVSWLDLNPPLVWGSQPALSPEEPIGQRVLMISRRVVWRFTLWALGRECRVRRCTAATQWPYSGHCSQILAAHSGGCDAR